VSPRTRHDFFRCPVYLLLFVFPKRSADVKHFLSGSAWRCQHFCADKRPQFKEKNPSLSFIELSKLQAAAWKELPEEDKAIYAAMHEVSTLSRCPVLLNLKTSAVGID
jgi:hypothetical protein